MCETVKRTMGKVNVVLTTVCHVFDVAFVDFLLFGVTIMLLATTLVDHAADHAQMLLAN